MAHDHDWTIVFYDVNPNNNFEVRPVTLSLKKSRENYDFCRAKLPAEVGREMKPHTRYKGGALYNKKVVDVKYNGYTVQRLMFRPDWVDYGSEFTHLQLHDLQKALSDGVIDHQRESVKLGKIYNKVINSATNSFIDGVKFTVPKNMEIVGTSGLNADFLPDWRIKQLERLAGTGWKSVRKLKKNKIEANQSKELLNSFYAVDFNEISPEKALHRLNKNYGLKSWINRTGTLIVGIPEANQIQHIAAGDDERVWRFKDPSVSHGREPIQTAAVWGAWEDEPGFEVNPLEWFDKGGRADVKAVGIANRKDIDYGASFSYKNTGAKSDSLPHVARLAMEERMKQQNTGTVEIDPDLSGDMISSVISLEPGDLLHLVPNDDYFDKPTATSGAIGDPPKNPDKIRGGFTNNEVYLVTEVEHNVSDGGDWQVHVDIGMYADVPIKSYMSYFDPRDEKWVNGSEINDDGGLAGGLFESV